MRSDSAECVSAMLLLCSNLHRVCKRRRNRSGTLDAWPLLFCRCGVAMDVDRSGSPSLSCPGWADPSTQPRSERIEAPPPASSRHSAAAIRESSAVDAHSPMATTHSQQAKRHDRSGTATRNHSTERRACLCRVGSCGGVAGHTRGQRTTPTESRCCAGRGGRRNGDSCSLVPCMLCVPCRSVLAPPSTPGSIPPPHRSRVFDAHFAV